MGPFVTVTGSDAEYIKNLIGVIAQTERNAAEVTAGEPEITVWIAVDGLSEDVRSATQLTFTEVAVAKVVMTVEIVARVVMTTAMMQYFPVEMIEIKKRDVECASRIFSSSRAETNRAGLIEKDDGDEEVTVGNSGMAPMLNASERDETGPTMRPMSTPGGMVAGTLESPLASGPCWSETDLKFTNEGMETKRFKVRGWGKDHGVSSVQENPGTRFDDRNDDMRQTDREGFVLKDWRHT